MKSILVIGAGPAGLYAAEKLSDLGHHVTIINRDIRPGGLAEYGIYLNKIKMKGSLRDYFFNILKRPNVRYLGNVAVGEKEVVKIEDLEKLKFDAIIVAIGAQTTKWLGLKGEDAKGVYHAKDLVFHYNGLPPYAEMPFPIGQTTCVVGIGNVALDMVHYLVCERQIDTVMTVARRGPAEVKYTKKELRIVSGALDLLAQEEEFGRIATRLLEAEQDRNLLFKDITKFASKPLEEPSPTRFSMKFFLSPCEIEKNQNNEVTGLVCQDTAFEKQEDGKLKLVKLGTTTTIPCDTVIFAIGDKNDETLGLPIDSKTGAYATVPSPWEEFPDRARYMVYDPEKGEARGGLFVVGWARNPSDGLVGKARLDAVTGCDEVIAYLDGKLGDYNSSLAAPEGVADQQLDQLLQEKNIRAVNFEEILHLDNQEALLANQTKWGVYRTTSNEKMLEIIDSM